MSVQLAYKVPVLGSRDRRLLRAPGPRARAQRPGWDLDPGGPPPPGSTLERGWPGALASDSVRRFHGSLRVSEATGTRWDIRVGHRVWFVSSGRREIPAGPTRREGGEVAPFSPTGHAASPPRAYPAAHSGERGNLELGGKEDLLVSKELLLGRWDAIPRFSPCRPRSPRPFLSPTMIFLKRYIFVGVFLVASLLFPGRCHRRLARPEFSSGFMLRFLS